MGFRDTHTFMRPLRTWEGLRRRWASVDSSARGIVELHDTVLPVLLVGADQADLQGVNTVALRAVVGAGVFARFTLAPPADFPVWLTGLFASTVTGGVGGGSVFARVIPGNTGSTTDQGNLVSGPGVPLLLSRDDSSVIAPTGAGLRLPPEQWVILPSPGIGLGEPVTGTTQTTVLLIECDQSNGDFDVYATYRSA